MPRYFFDTRDAEAYTEDAIGMELPDVDTACKYVGSLLTRLAQRDLPNGEVRSFECSTRDEAGAVVYRGEMVHRGTRF
jgi:hypothetical protein